MKTIKQKLNIIEIKLLNKLLRIIIWMMTIRERVQGFKCALRAKKKTFEWVFENQTMLLLDYPNRDDLKERIGKCFDSFVRKEFEIAGLDYLEE